MPTTEDFLTQVNRAMKAEARVEELEQLAGDRGDERDALQESEDELCAKLTALENEATEYVDGAESQFATDEKRVKEAERLVGNWKESCLGGSVRATRGCSRVPRKVRLGPSGPVPHRPRQARPQRQAQR